MRRAGLLFLLALMPVQAMAAAFPAGVWFGQGEPGDRSEMFLVHAEANGRIHVQFRRCREGKPFDNFNEGKWTRSGDRLTVRYSHGNGQPIPAPHDDFYTLLAAEGGKQSYRMESSGFVFSARAMDAKFQMPPCDLTS